MNNFKYNNNTNNDLPIVIETSQTYYGAYLKKNDTTVGRFEIGIVKPHDLAINIDDEYQGKKYAKKLIGALCDYLKTNRILNDADNLYIDSDVSHDINGKSFWDRIGMTDTPHDDPYFGWEKVITFKKLCEFATSKKIERPRSRSRSRSRLRSRSRSRSSNKIAGGKKKPTKKNTNKKHTNKKKLKK